MSSTGFITFKDLASVSYAVRAPISEDPDVMTVAVAPEPRDIVWENAHVNLTWSAGRAWTANVLLFFGAILWSVPVAGIQALATFDTLGKISISRLVHYLSSVQIRDFLFLTLASHCLISCGPINYICSRNSGLWVASRLYQ